MHGFLPIGSIETIGESVCGYRHAVMDYYNECGSRYNTTVSKSIDFFLRDLSLVFFCT